jgi:hypothetical protein
VLRLLSCINAGLTVLYGVMWFSIWGDHYWNGDFTAFYTGLLIVSDGLGSSLFDFDLQFLYQQNLLNGRIFKDGLLPFVWPPHSVPIFIPLTWFPLKTSFLIFSVSQFLALVLIAYFVFKLPVYFPLTKIILSVLLLTSFFSTFYTFISGNQSLFILLSILGCYYSIKKGSDYSAGAWLALGTIKPQLVLMPVMMLIVGKKWKVITGFVLTIFPFILLSTVMLGWKIWIEYLFLLQKVNQYFDYMGFYPAAMYNLKGTLYSSIGSQQWDLIIVLSTIGLILGLIFTVLLWHKKFDTQSSDFELRFALTILIGLFFSPHLYGHDYVLVCAALIALIVYAGNSSRSLSLVKFFSVFPILFFATEIVYKVNVGIRFPTLMMIILMGWISWKLFKDHRAQGQL